jgi:anti-sigma factor RsiW
MPAPDVHTLIGAYALDALDDDDRAAFDEHLAECEPCREETAGLRRTVGRLAEGSAVPPPAQLRERVLERIARTPQVRDLAPRGRVAQPLRRAGGRSRLWLAAAAVLAVTSIGSGTIAWSQYRTAQEARTTEQSLTAVLADPSARVVAARLPNGGTTRLVVAAGRAVVAGAGLPALPQGRTYQLWIIRGRLITSAGLGPAGPSADGAWSRLVDGVRAGDVVAVSVEPVSGSRQPTTSPVVTLQT